MSPTYVALGLNSKFKTSIPFSLGIPPLHNGGGVGDYKCPILSKVWISI